MTESKNDVLNMLDSQLSTIVKRFNHDIEKIDRQLILSGYSSDVQKNIDKLMTAQAAMICKLDTALHDNKLENMSKELMQELRKQTFPWLMKSHCFKRSYEKPQGYAGDFNIIDTIYRNIPSGEGVGLPLDKYYLNSGSGKAMRSREKYIVEKLIDIIDLSVGHDNKSISLLDIGCGPGRDILDIFTGLNKRIALKATLIDQDKDAIEYSRELLTPFLDKIDFKIINLLKIIAAGKHAPRKFGNHDVIMCIGLFDYLDKDTAAKLGSSMYAMLNEKGTMILSNWNVSNPNRTELEWLCDWELVHRTDNDMHELIRLAGIPMEKAEFTKDPSGHFLISLAHK